MGEERLAKNEPPPPVPLNYAPPALEANARVKAIAFVGGAILGFTPIAFLSFVVRADGYLGFGESPVVALFFCAVAPVALLVGLIIPRRRYSHWFLSGALIGVTIAALVEGAAFAQH